MGTKSLEGLHLKHRPEIDGLRAVAVLLVVGYHLFPGHAPGGFIGVDIFFVISGYLISGNIIDEVDGGVFSYLRFYARRVRRIFPALIAVLVTTLAAGAILFLPDEFSNLCSHIVAAAFFLANFKLWFDAGYFDTAASTKPLLHLWSLGIEEQFYIFWPLVLVLIGRAKRHRIAVIAIAATASFALNVMLIAAYPVATFYAPATRLWELLAGALLVTLVRGGSVGSRSANVAMAAMGLAIIAICTALYSTETKFPGWAALAPVVGAAMVIAADSGVIAKVLLANPMMVYIGRISYPLYLWHWPLIAILRIENSNGVVGTPVRIAIVLLSIALAAATYEWIEKPIRSQRADKRLLLSLLGVMAASASVAFMAPAAERLVVLRRSDVELSQLQWDFWENQACDAAYPWKYKHGWWFCMASSPKPPTMILLGDSHANQLYPGLRDAFPDQSILSIGTCDPAEDIYFPAADIGENPCNGSRKGQQDAFIRNIIEHTPSLHYAILSAMWLDFEPNGMLRMNDTVKSVLRGIDAPGTQGLSAAEKYYRGLDRRISFLERRGMEVVLVFSTPDLPYDVRECIRRPFVAAQRDCHVKPNMQVGFRQLAARLKANHPRLRLFDPIPVFCRDGDCSLKSGSTVFLRDNHHLSVAGSRAVGMAFRKAMEMQPFPANSP